MSKQTVIGNLKDIIHKWYYTEEEVDQLLTTKADLNHVHDYITQSEIEELLETKAPVNHTHHSREVVDLRFVMDTKAPVNHTHTEYYPREDIDAENAKLQKEIENIIGFRTKIVEDLEGEGQEGVVYLKLKEDGDEGNVYDEYIYIDGSYEKIGSTDIHLDMSSYVTQTSLTNQLESYSLKEHDHSQYETRQEAEESLALKADDKPASTESNGLLTAEDFVKLAGIESQANNITVDESLNSESNNPVANKAINTQLVELNQNYDLLEPQLTELQETQETTVTQLTNANQAQAEQITTQESTIEKLTSENAELTTKNGELESANEELTTENQSLQEQLEEYEGHTADEIKKLEEENQELKEAIQDITAQIELKADNVLATADKDGLMSSTNFIKLRDVEEGANKIEVDNQLDESSMNPVVNSAINSGISPFQSQINTLESQVDQLESETVEELSKLRKENQELHDTNSQLEQSITNMNAQIEEKTQENTYLVSEMKKVMDSDADIQAGLDYVNSLLDSKLDKTQYASSTSDGLMSSSDWIKLNGIAKGANRIIVDGVLDGGSGNPVKNSVINSKVESIETEIAELQAKIGELQ